MPGRERRPQALPANCPTNLEAGGRGSRAITRCRTRTRGRPSREVRSWSTPATSATRCSRGRSRPTVRCSTCRADRSASPSARNCAGKAIATASNRPASRGSSTGRAATCARSSRSFRCRSSRAGTASPASSGCSSPRPGASTITAGPARRSTRRSGCSGRRCEGSTCEPRTARRSARRSSPRWAAPTTSSSFPPSSSTGTPRRPRPVRSRRSSRGAIRTCGPRRPAPGRPARNSRPDSRRA